MPLRGERPPTLHEIHLRRSLWGFLPPALDPPPPALDFGESLGDAHLMLDQVTAEDCSRAPEPSQTVDINRPPGLEGHLNGLLNLAHPLGCGRVHIGYWQTPVNDSPIPRPRLLLQERRIRLKPFALFRQIEKEVYAHVQK